jgi:hypothetical protein
MNDSFEPITEKEALERAGATNVITPNVARFVQEMTNLCRKHKLQIATSDHDSIQIWPLEDETENPINCCGLEDKTYR